MSLLRGVDHVCLGVEDVGEAAARWQLQFGLALREAAGGRATLACADEPYSLELVEATTPGHRHTAFELDPAHTLADAAEHLESHGVASRLADGALFLEDADGAEIELVPARSRAQGSSRPPGADAAPFRPRRLGHVTVFTGAYDRQVGFYTDVLGLRVSDRLEGAGTWLHVRPGADHHVVAVMDLGYAHFHHLALELTAWDAMRDALDHLAAQGRWTAWGPLRHALGQNLASYVRVPEERCFVELYCEMEQIAAGREPRVWPDDRFSSNAWGQLPPRSFFRFDDAAVAAERDSLEMLGLDLPPPGDEAGRAAAPARGSRA